MPLQPSVTYPIFMSALTSAACVGTGALKLAQGLSGGLFAYSLTGITVTTTDAGILGVGKGTGTSILTPAATIPNMIEWFSVQGINGIFSIPIATAVGNAMSICVSSALVNTFHPTVGSGTGVGTLVPTTGAPFFIASFASAGIVGPMGVNMAIAVANGLDAALLTTLVNVGILGSTSPASSTGVGSGKIS